MTAYLRLAAASAWNRRGTLALIVLSIALSVAMLLGVQRAKNAAREAFELSVSGTDLVVGARTSPVQLMLYAVFRLGEATHNMKWSSYQDVAALPQVEWAVPLSLGDSHRGFAVLATTPAYFERFRYGYKRTLSLVSGRAFAGTLDGLYEVVVGAEVARSLGYATGTRITLRHGTSAQGTDHADKPFTIVGVLAPTGTPVDRTVHISLQGMEAIHLDWQGGAPMPGMKIPPELARKFDLQPKAITAALVGLKNRALVFRAQRSIHDYAGEPLLAVLPGVALDQLWQVVGVVERSLQAVSWLVVAIGVAGLVAVVLAGLNERRRELAILRSVGCGPWQIAGLLVLESTLATMAGIAVGVALLGTALAAANPWLESAFGLPLRLGLPQASEWLLVLAVLVAGALAGALPAWRAARLALADGLSPRI